MSTIIKEEQDNNLINENINCPKCGKSYHRKFNFFVIFPYILLLGLVIFIFWSFTPSQMIKGEWVGKNKTIEILPKNIINIKSGNDSYTGGTYTIIDSETAKVNLGGLGFLFGPMIVKYDVSFDTLKISYENKTEVFERTSYSSFLVKTVNDFVKVINKNK